MAKARTAGRLELLCAGVLAALAILFFPFRFAFELDPDEGINLIKSVLVSQGAELYTQVWSDQPPLLTQLLAGLFRLFGVQLTAARLLILACSCALLWGAARYLRREFGTPHAIAGAAILITLPSYLRLSVSVMIGLPALALAMLSFLAVAAWHRDGRTRWLILSGAALGLSVMTKLFTGLLAPVFLLGLSVRELRMRPARRQVALPALIWTAAFGAAALSIGLIWIDPAAIRQLVLNHWAGRGVELAGATSLGETLRGSLPVLLLAVVGSAQAMRLRRASALYLTVWAAAALVLLSQHSPLWYHHQLLITVPAALLAGCAVGESVRVARARFAGIRLSSWNGLLHAATPVLVLWTAVSAVPKTVGELDVGLPNLLPPEADRRQIEAVDLLDVMGQYAETTHLIVTDRPMLAIWLDKPVPPEVAALTGKRLLTGDLTEQEIIAAIQRHQPEQVALARFELPQVEAYLRGHYRLAYALRDHRLYLRPDLQSAPAG